MATVEAEVDEVVVAVTEAVATAEAAVAGKGTSVNLAEEPVVAEDAEPIGGHLSSLPFRL